MTTLSITGQVSPDGMLQLQIPTNLPAGPVEAIIVLQPVVPDDLQTSAPLRTRSGLFSDLSPDLDIDAALKEIRSQWQRQAREP